MSEIIVPRVVTRAEALAAGYTDAHIRWQLSKRRWIQLRRGVYAVYSDTAASPGDRERAIAEGRAIQARLGADVVVSHEWAALIHGFAVLVRPQFVTATRDLAPTRSPAIYPRLRVRTAALRAEDVMEVEGVWVTTPERTVIDVARHASVRGGVVTADSALHANAVTKDQLAEVIERCPRWPYVNRARKVVNFADGRAESPHESTSRVILVLEHDVPSPELQIPIVVQSGKVYWCDLGWEEESTVGEADGFTKYTSMDVLRAEKLRQDDIEEAGQAMVRWTPMEIGRWPEQVVRRLYRKFTRRRRHLTG